MEEKLKNSIMRWLTISLLAVIVVGGLIVLCPRYRQNQALKHRLAELETRISQKQANVAALRENQRRFSTDPDFLEKIARQNHRVFPGEVVFVFD